MTDLVITFIDVDGIDQEIPARYIVCDRCAGTGTHVNPNIDAQGLSHDLVDDPEFMQNYRNGVYDVTCSECQGKRVVLVPDGNKCRPTLLSEYYRALQEEIDVEAEIAAELRFGA